jgi:hypothetical protein
MRCIWYGFSVLSHDLIPPLQNHHTSLDDAIAALDAALLLLRKFSSSRHPDISSIEDAAAAVCAVSWILLQPQPALFGRAACEHRLFTRSISISSISRSALTATPLSPH